MSTDAAELRKLVKQLQGASISADIIGILNILKSNFEVNEQILRESKAGLAVGKLRSHDDKSVSDLAKEIVKKWKGAVERAKQKDGGSGAAGGGTTPKPANKPTNTAKKPAAATPGTPGTPTSNSSARSAKTDGVKASTGDATRDKCAELLYDALASDSGAPSELILEKAIAVEKVVHKDHGGTTMQYKSRIRVLFVNLKDKHNPSLRENVVAGEISAEKVARMTSQDMASEERKAADNKIKEENFFNSLGAGEQQAETDAFQCGRCKQRKCRYRQAQTRSADEPMTTFVTCVNCGNRWKFS
ncbi:hypothetical protein AX16_001850 [Volvariella volvacea WC 439]|nr:hypothetical protein AX16_001850 [Volvariella volvacea WC 439]